MKVFPSNPEREMREMRRMVAMWDVTIGVRPMLCIRMFICFYIPSLTRVKMLLDLRVTKNF
jgi:hypothetical protein